MEIDNEVRRSCRGVRDRIPPLRNPRTGKICMSRAEHDEGVVKGTPVSLPTRSTEEASEDY